MLRSKLWTVVFFVILGLCTGLWYQSQKINSLKTENQAQAQAIQEQQLVNQRLTGQLEQERQAVEHQQKIVNELRLQVETERDNVKTVLVKEPSANVAMPNAVINSIKRLHKIGGYKD